MLFWLIEVPRQSAENVWFLNFSIFFFSYFGLQKSLSLSLFSNICVHSFFFFLSGVSDSRNWSCPRIMKFFFRKCSIIVLRYFSLYLSVCVCFQVLRKCVKIKSFWFLDIVFDCLWWGFHLLGNKYGPMMGF